MQIIRECRMRATILIELAKDAPELEDQLLYVARKWLTLAALREQLNAGADRGDSAIRQRRASARRD